MRNLNRSLSAARQSGGFTLVELLVVIGIIAILAGVALGPITNGIKKARESSAMQTCRTLGLAEFQFSNDNGTYPDGADAGAVAQALVTGNYVSDPSIFRISGDASATPPAAAGQYTAGNVSYDFMGFDDNAAAKSGIPSGAPDLLPVVWSPSAAVTAPSGVGGSAKPNTTTPNYFGTDGVAIAYHSNNAFFRTSGLATGPTSVWPGALNWLIVDKGTTMDAGTFGTGGIWQLRLGADNY